MTIWVCVGKQGCYKPCELNDFTAGIPILPEGTVQGFCRFTGEPVDWMVKE